MARAPEQSTWRGRLLTYAQLAGGMTVFGSATPVSKIVTSSLPVFLAGGLRVALGGLALLPFVLHRRAAVSAMSTRDWLRVGVIALVGMFGFTAFMLYGMRMVSGVAGAVVMSTTPAVTAIGAMLFLKERPTWRKLAAIALAVAGVLALQLGSGREDESSGTDNLLGLLLVFAAVCCEATYTLLGKRASERGDPVVVAGLSALLALPLFAPLAVWQAQSFSPTDVSAKTWLALAWYGLGTLALGSWLWYAGVVKAQGSVAAAFMGVMPVSALLLSYLLLGEPFRWPHLLGFALVLLGVLLIAWEHARMLAET